MPTAVPPCNPTATKHSRRRRPENPPAKCYFPSQTGKPSAPSVVETTGRAAAQASRILRRVPLPATTGTTATSARASSANASSTGPVHSIRVSPATRCRTASGFFPTRRHTSRGPTFAQTGPNRPGEKAHGGNIGVVFQIPGKHNHMFFRQYRDRPQRNAIGVDPQARAGREEGGLATVRHRGHQHLAETRQPGRFQPPGSAAEDSMRQRRAGAFHRRATRMQQRLDVVEVEHGARAVRR
jgi:hypothetical protein